MRRVLRAKFKAGLFDNPYTDPKRAQSEILAPENLATARKMAQESIVLVKNENGLLPLDKEIKTIALIGPLVDDKANQLGSWVANGSAQDAVTPHEGIKAKLPNATFWFLAAWILICKVHIMVREQLVRRRLLRQQLELPER